MNPGDEGSARTVAERLVELGARQVVLKLGAAGAAIFDGRRFEYLPGHSIEAVDTTAAGDAFTAALGVAIARAEDLESATRFANAAGALACTRLGAQQAMPKREEIDGLLG